MIKPEKWQQLLQWMNKLGIQENDINEKFILGSGSGGQKINKTASCVYIKHVKSGIEIKCQQSRSRELNRYYARYRLCEKLEEQILGEKSKKQKAIEKLKRQKRTRSKRAKQKILNDKNHQSQIKNNRKPPTNHED